ncbi:MAG TPA: bifunctional phosphoglucose/phosphomannose isomerase [bacterium]|nr:bifunctional phosphoglucose/phosphomannose isomerase [bacterium]
MEFSKPDERRRKDPSGMLELILRLPRMCAEAWSLPVRPEPRPERPEQIVALGMGGSGIGGDLLRAVLYDVAPVPVISAKEYRAPSFVGPRSLVFACSYSGNTEETLAAYDDAAARGARCLAITSGGELLRRARERRHPAVVVPPGVPPRAALAYMFLPMLAVLSRTGIVRSYDAELREAVTVVKDTVGRLGPDGTDPSARALAERLLGRIPVVYSALPFLEPAAQRWKDQFNENAKTFGVWNTFPELNHNETVGWGVDPALARMIHVIILRDPHEPARLGQRVTITKELAFRNAAGLDEIASEGEGRLARLLSIIAHGDLVSWYLALLRGVDPTPVAVIEDLKKRLAETGAV